ncbi:CHRD domain-containing protein [Flavobacteriaceae bacterium KMM 6898]|nr:CHRD domain-containing protein [Flavobacteriaceae bacterium KMM 6898]
MKHLIGKLLITLLISPLIFISCSSDDGNQPDPPVDESPTEVNSKTYNLVSVTNPDISGTAKFIELSDATVTVELKLQNTTSGGQHPAHIHVNTAAEGGGIARTLGTVDGGTGESTINFSTLDDGTSITYGELLNFDGYINVHLSTNELSTIVAQGDIGQNELTGTSKEYFLGEKDISGINGSAWFYERKNGEALAVINLENTTAGGEYPGHIHNNTAVVGGGIAFSFNAVNGDTGNSKTNVTVLDDGTPFGYDDVLDFNGYINIHLSATELSTLVAQGDIGQNELTGQTISYDLAEKDVAGVSGTVFFAERKNLTTLVSIQLSGTSAGGAHPAHIHENDAATGGGIVIDLTEVNGDTGISVTQVAALNNGTAITYAELLAIDAYINVHLSAVDLGTLVAQGNIGSNTGGTESKTFTITNNGEVAYVFNEEGFSNTENPNLTFKRGGTYIFNVTAPGHPFLIKSVQGIGTSDQYNDGVTNNGVDSGSVTFVVPTDAPNTLYYNCEFHSPMTGTITITN